MTAALRRELVGGALLGVTLAVGAVLARWEHALVLGGVVIAGLVAWTWPRTVYDRLKSRIATTSLVGIFGAIAALIAIAKVGVAPSVLAVAVVAAGVAARDRARLRGAALPAEGEMRGRVTFDGTAHAIGEATRIPGTELAVLLWVARQGRRRWSSTGRVELRSEQRKVLLDPRGAAMRGDPWVPSRGLAREVVRDLDGADLSRPIRVWSLREGDAAYVVGGAAVEDDPEAPSFRDPGRVRVFTGELVVGGGRRAEALRDASARILLWSIVAAAAGALAGFR